MKTKTTKPRKFILCPVCQSKTKKLWSEMGGLQTRRCSRGHQFEIDTWGGMNRVQSIYPNRY